MVRVLGHRQTKGAATDHLDLPPPRHISTLQNYAVELRGRLWPDSGSVTELVVSTRVSIARHSLQEGFAFRHT